MATTHDEKQVRVLGACAVNLHTSVHCDHVRSISLPVFADGAGGAVAERAGKEVVLATIYRVGYKTQRLNTSHIFASAGGANSGGARGQGGGAPAG